MTATPLSLRFAESQARNYRRTWKGSAFTTFLNPVLFLTAMGLGLGTLVDRGAGAAALDVDYLAFIAPGLLAATAMQTGTGDGSYPVVAGIKWTRTYHAALATPVGIPDLVAGHLLWVGVRLVFSSFVYALVMVAFGAVSFGGGALAIGPAVLTGIAFAASVTAFSGWIQRETGLSSLFRFAIIPMFLLSGTFFPIEQLPSWVQPVAMFTPLWHGVELTRAVALGSAPELSPIWHVSYLIAWTAAGWLLAVRTFRKRLQP